MLGNSRGGIVNSGPLRQILRYAADSILNCVQFCSLQLRFSPCVGFSGLCVDQKHCEDQ